MCKMAELPLVVMIDADDPRVDSKIDNDALRATWFDNDADERQLISNTGYMNIDKIDAVYPSAISEYTSVSVGNTERMVLLPIDEVMKRIRDVK